MILLESRLSLSFPLPSSDKTQCFVHLSFDSTLQLINGTSSDLQKLLRYFNGRQFLQFFRIPLLLLATVFPNNLTLYLEDLKKSVFAISLLKLVALSLEKNHKLPVVSE